MFGELAEQLIAAVRIMPVRAWSISRPQPAPDEQGRIARETGDMVEQMLDADRAVGRQRGLRKQRDDPVGQAEATVGGELMEQDRGERLADRADLEKRVGRDRGSRVGIGEARMDHCLEATRAGHPEGQAGKVEPAAMGVGISLDRRHRIGLGRGR